MKYLGYFLKDLLYKSASLVENIFYHIRFYFYMIIGKFNEDYTSERNKNGWELTFEDDFNTPEIDWNKWNKWWSEYGDDPTKTGGKHSLDCLIWDGNTNMIFRTIKNDDETSPFPCKAATLFSAYDSWYDENGQKQSKGWQQMFGYFEIRCVPPAQGKLFWPAFWLWANTWPPEIDIFEFMSKEDIGTESTKGIAFTSHWGYEGKSPKSRYFGTQLSISFRKFLKWSVNWNEHYHTYACKWTPYYIKWYVDDKCVHKMVYNIPTTQMSITVSNGAYVDNPPTEEDLPGDFIVDYVRAYKKI